MFVNVAGPPCAVFLIASARCCTWIAYCRSCLAYSRSCMTLMLSCVGSVAQFAHTKTPPPICARPVAGFKTVASATVAIVHFKLIKVSPFAVLNFFHATQVLRPVGKAFEPQPLRPPCLRVLLHNALDNLPLFAAIYADPGERNLSNAEIDQAPAHFADHVVVLLRHADLQDVQFAFVEADPFLEGARSWSLRFRVGQQNLRWTVFENHVRNIRVCDVADLLCRHDDHRILAPHGLQPVPEAIAKQSML